MSDEIGADMETFKINLDTQVVNIHLFGDEHIGDANCDITYLKERIEKCRLDDNGVAVVLGDVLNNAIASSVSFAPYGDELTPLQQMELAVEIFKPIADKIILWLDGNHELRTSKSGVGIDISHIIAKELNVNYSPTSALLFIRFGQTDRQRPITYTVYCRHGSQGGGRKTGGRANALENNQEIVDADLYLGGHTHQSIVFTKSFFRCDFRNSAVSKVTHTFVNIPSAMTNYGGYGDRMGFSPSDCTYPLVTLHNWKKKVNVTM